MKFINAIFGVFGYQWVLDTTPVTVDDDANDLLDDNDWEDLCEHTPRYVLRKIAP